MADLWQLSGNSFAALPIVPNPEQILKKSLIMDNKEYCPVEVPILPKLCLQ